LFGWGEMPIPAPPINPADMPAIAQEGSPLYLKLRQAHVTPKMMQSMIPSSLMQPSNGSPKVNSIISLLGILTIAEGGQTEPLGRYVRRVHDGDVAGIFGDSQILNGNGHMNRRTPKHGPISEFMDTIMITAAAPMIPATSVVHLHEMLQGWLKFDRPLQQAPFVLSPGLRINVDAQQMIGTISLKMKLYQDKIIHFRNALERQEMLEAFIQGYDILVLIQNLALEESPNPSTAVGAKKFHIFNWKNILTTAPPTRMVIFGWVKGGGSIHLLPEPIDCVVPQM
jgi:hypothetical protein